MKTCCQINYKRATGYALINGTFSVSQRQGSLISPTNIFPGIFIQGYKPLRMIRFKTELETFVFVQDVATR